MPALTEQELMVRTRDWALELCQIVPEDKLLETFRQATRDHNSTFPLNFYDMTMAYRTLQNARPVINEAEFQRLLMSQEVS